MSLYDTFCANLRDAIATEGYSIRTLALESGYSASYIQRVLAGVQRNPTLAFIECVAKVLGTTPQSMIRDRSAPCIAG